MREVTFKSGASVPAGTKLMLAFVQADARASSVESLAPNDVAKAQDEVAMAKRALAAAKGGADLKAIIDAEQYLAEARTALNSARFPYLAKENLYFKAGETIEMERGDEFGRALTDALGLEANDRPLAEREATRTAANRRAVGKKAPVKGGKR